MTDRRARRTHLTKAVAVLFWLVLAVWLTRPLWGPHFAGPDLIPYHVQGSFVGVDDDLVFVAGGDSLNDLPEPVLKRHCAALELPDDRDLCRSFAVPALGTPMLLPFSVAIAQLPIGTADVLVDLIAALAASTAMIVLWRALAWRGAAEAGAVAATAVALTPLVFWAADLTQLAPILFVATVLPPVRHRLDRQTVVSSSVWALAIVVKGFPALLAALQLYRRRLASLAVAGGLLFLLAISTLLLVPVGSVTGSVADAGGVSRAAVAVPSNLSLASFVADARGGLSTLGVLVCSLTVLLVVLAIWWRFVRHAEAELEWVYLLLGTMLAMPIVWWHYAFVAVGAVGVAAAVCIRRRSNDAHGARPGPERGAPVEQSHDAGGGPDGDRSQPHGILLALVAVSAGCFLLTDLAATPLVEAGRVATLVGGLVVVACAAAGGATQDSMSTTSTLSTPPGA